MPAQSLGNREVAHCLPASLLFRLISAGAWDPALHSSPPCQGPSAAEATTATALGAASP